MEFESDGARIHYDVHGDGEPLLWLHGFTGAGSDWKYQFADVPRGYQLIAPDLRGHGASTSPSDHFSFRQAARDMLALLAQLRLIRTKAIGISGGGITLLHMAALQPDALNAMVVVSAPPYYPEPARAIQRQFSPQLLPENEWALMRARHAGGEEQIARLFANVRSFADDYEDVNFPADVLAKITVRTLLVFGDRDPLYPVSLAVEMYEAMPHASLWVVPDGGHGPVFGRHAELFCRTALAFLDEEAPG